MPEICPRCKGRGWRRVSKGNGQRGTKWLQCLDCWGTGYVIRVVSESRSGANEKGAVDCDSPRANAERRGDE